MVKDTYLYRHLDSEYYRNPLSVLGLDYYKKFSAGEDDFSRKQVWFYVYGDEEIKEEFHEDLTSMLETVFDQPSKTWDKIVVLPSHAKNKHKRSMTNLVEDIAEDLNIDFENFLKRTHTIHRNHELETMKEKVINLENSLSLNADVENKNIIIVDNITLSGSSLMNAADLLKDSGAANVLAVCIGLDSRNSENDTEFNENNAEAIRRKIIPEGGQ